jgi:hypothetical protein
VRAAYDEVYAYANGRRGFILTAPGDSAVDSYSPMILINARFLRPPSNSP